MRREIFFIGLLSLIVTISAAQPLLAEEEIKFAITAAIGSDPDFNSLFTSTYGAPPRCNRVRP